MKKKITRRGAEPLPRREAPGAETAVETTWKGGVRNDPYLKRPRNGALLDYGDLPIDPPSRYPVRRFAKNPWREST